MDLQKSPEQLLELAKVRNRLLLDSGKGGQRKIDAHEVLI